MERALLLTGAVLLAAWAGCPAGADHATVPPAVERELSGSTSTMSTGSAGATSRPGTPSSGSASTPRAPSSGNAYAQNRPTGEAKAWIVAGAGGAPGQSGHGAYICKLIGSPAVSLSSAKSSMSGSGVALAFDATESDATVLEMPEGENNLATYCTDPGGVGQDFAGTSGAFVVTEGGSTDVEITADPQP
ncbi:hypothetical protein [Arthrobacter sp.]|uniref:hypothetical protein n=1 Tax=Arthrobacter sp. TaxID=1667 RepID=UPI00339879BB